MGNLVSWFAEYYSIQSVLFHPDILNEMKIAIDEKNECLVEHPNPKDTITNKYTKWKEEKIDQLRQTQERLNALKILIIEQKDTSKIDQYVELSRNAFLYERKLKKGEEDYIQDIKDQSTQSKKFYRLYKALLPIWLVCPKPVTICQCLSKLKLEPVNIESIKELQKQFMVYWKHQLDPAMREMVVKIYLKELIQTETTL